MFYAAVITLLYRICEYLDRVPKSGNDTLHCSLTLIVMCLQGYGATAHLESGGFIRSRPQVQHPDIQFHFLPSQVIDHGRVASKVEAYQVSVLWLDFGF